MLVECCRNQWRTWTRCLLISCVLVILLIGIIVGIVHHISSKADSGPSRDEVISELMSKHLGSNNNNDSRLTTGRNLTRIFWSNETNENYTKIVIVEEEIVEPEKVNLHPLDIWTASDEMEQNFKYYLAGYDYQNLPVWIVPFGTWNLKDFLNADDENVKLLDMYVYQYAHRVERSRLQMTEPGNYVNTSFVLICDMDGYSYSQFASMSTMSFLVKMANIFAIPLAEMEYGIVVNLDWVSRMLVNVVRPILSEALAKMILLGSDKEEYIKLMLEKIPATQLPEIYGGNEQFEPVAAYG